MYAVNAVYQVGRQAGANRVADLAVLFGIAHKMLLGQALDMTLGRGMTIALFPLFGLLGAWLALKRVNGLTDAA